MTNTSPFILVDGSSYLYRAFHALPPLMTASGQPTGAIFGVINMIRKLVQEYQPKYMAVVFDAKGKTFRHELYPKYKANRPPMPDELRVQIEPLHEIIKAMNIPLLVIEGVEADDVIGALAKEATKLGMKTLISTGDKDLAQLVDDHVTLIDTMTNVTMDEKGVEKKFGVKPEQIVDFLALIGDKSDNVPGVEKVGPKTAVKWLEEFGSLENILKNAGSIKGKVGENLRAFAEQLPLSKELVTIKCDIKLPFKVEELIDSEDDKYQLKKIFTQLEFKTWLKDYENGNNSEAKKPELKYEVILTQSDFDKWLNIITKEKFIAVDTETTAIDYMKAELVGISFATKNNAAYLPLRHKENIKQLDFDSVLKKLKPILENAEIKKVGQHIKYDKEIFANYAIALNGIEHDTMLESYINDSTATRHDLDSLALKYLNHKNISYEDVCGKGVKQIIFDEVPVADAAKYAAEDAFITMQLHEHLWPLLRDNLHLKEVYQNIEIPLINVLATMERNGVLVDAKYLQDLSKQFAKRMEELQEKSVCNCRR